MKTKQLLILALVLLAITLVVNYMGATGIINNLSQKDVSDQFPTPLTPEPLAFSIWGLIYLSVILSLLYLLKNHQEAWAVQATEAIAFPFYAICLINMTWIVIFSYKLMALSAVFTFAMNFTLAYLLKRMEKNRRAPLSLPGFAFGLFTGWTLIAAVLNVTIWLVSIKWNGFGIAYNVWAMIVLVVALLLAVFVSWNLKNAVLALPGAWAYLHIGLRHANAEGFPGADPRIQWIAWIGGGVLLLYSIYLFYRNGKSILPRIQGGLSS